jgi:uncharacterized protein YprB with RNaseH-like and TPR domain
MLATEVGMNPSTLDRRLREISQYTQEEAVAKTRSSKKQQRYQEIEYPPVTLRAAVFDIETTSFSTGGPQDHLVCMCAVPLDNDDVITVRLEFKDRRDDRRILRETWEQLSQFDILIGHNIQAFDLNILFSRGMYFGIKPPRKFATYDTYQVARRLAIKDRKSLGNLASFFGLQGTKTSVFRPFWTLVDSPFRKDFDTAMHEIVYHCQQDVLLNRQLFHVLWNYDPFKTFKTTKW